MRWHPQTYGPLLTLPVKFLWAFSTKVICENYSGISRSREFSLNWSVLRSSISCVCCNSSWENSMPCPLRILRQYRQLLILASDTNSTSASLLCFIYIYIRNPAFTHHRRCKRKTKSYNYRIISSLSLAFSTQWRLMEPVVSLLPSFPVSKPVLAH